MRLFDLFKPAWQSKNKQKAIKAIKKLTDLSIILHIIKSYNMSYDVRNEAEKRFISLTKDQLLLKKTISENWYSSNQIAAIIKITDQNFLAEVARNDRRNSDVRMAAFKNLTDQRLIADVVKNNNSNNYKESEMYQDTVKNLTDQIVLVDIAKNAKSTWTRKSAIQNLEDQATLVDIAKNDTDSGVRIAAAEKLTDKSFAQKVFIGIVQDDQEHKLSRERAYEKITDQTVLQAISNDPFVKELIREKAHIERLANTERERQKKINDCKNHVWTAHNGGDYPIYVCIKCGATK